MIIRSTASIRLGAFRLWNSLTLGQQCVGHHILGSSTPYSPRKKDTSMHKFSRRYYSSDFDDRQLREGIERGFLSFVKAYANYSNKNVGLVDAIRLERFEIATWLLGNGAKAGDDLLWTVLESTYSEPTGQKKMVELLLDNGVNVNVPVQEGYLPIHYTAKHGHVELLKVFLDAGADPNEISEDGKTPLLIAIQDSVFSYRLTNAKNARLVLETLLAAGATVDYKCLRAACTYRDVWVAKRLVAAKSDFDAVKLMTSMDTNSLEEDVVDFLYEVVRAPKLTAVRLKQSESLLMKRMEIAAKYGLKDEIKKAFDELTAVYHEMKKLHH